MKTFNAVFADGCSKAFTLAGDRHAHVDTLHHSLPATRADLSYKPDGTLTAVAQNEV